MLKCILLLFYIILFIYKLVDAENCFDKENACPSNQECRNISGDFVCTCKTGYREDLISGICNDIDECKENICEDKGECRNTIGSFICDCKTGFDLNTLTGLCFEKEKKLNKRQIGPEKEQQTHCGKGFQLNPVNNNCEDINECAQGIDDCIYLGENYQCVNIQGSYRCDKKLCVNGKCFKPVINLNIFLTKSFIPDITSDSQSYPNGYIEYSSGLSEGKSNRNQSVKSNFQGNLHRRNFNSTCTKGYQYEDSSQQCIDIDECFEENNCDVNQECINSIGNYQCVCKSGYEMDSLNKSCIEIMEKLQKSEMDCSIPNITNGYIQVLEDNSTYEWIPNKKTIIVTCDEGYVLYPGKYSLLVCYEGKYNLDIPQCLTTCYMRSSDSVKFTCEKDSEEINCFHEYSLVEGTEMKMECKYVFSPTVTTICKNRAWDKPLINCDIDCGQRASEYAPTYLVNAFLAKQFEFPWHVGFYEREEEKSIYFCGGTLIHTKYVLSVAHCFARDENGVLLNPSNYFVVAGTVHLGYSKNDTSAQKRNVIDINIPSTYRGALANFASDIAVVVLEKPFILTDTVQVICIDLNSRHRAIRSNSGTIVGWGLTGIDTGKPSKELKTLTVPIIDTKTCMNTYPKVSVRYITSDKFCAGYKNGSSACDGDSGGGFFLEKEIGGKRSFYIEGLISTGHRNDIYCDPFQYTIYTKLSNYLNFIEKFIDVNVDGTETIQEPSKENGCLLRGISNGYFIVSYDGNKIYKNLQEEIVIPDNTLVTFYCNIPRENGSEYIMKPMIRENICRNRRWDKTLPSCYLNRASVPRLYPRGFCEFWGLPNSNIKVIDINGNETMLTDVKYGDSIVIECDKNYELSKPYNIVTCGIRNFNLPLPSCRLACGNINNNHNITHFPWHVAIYKQDNDTNTLKKICGGTIINLNFVLSAAYCFTNESTGEIEDNSSYYVFAGMNSGSSSSENDSMFWQKRKVDLIMLANDLYRGELTKFAGDIAVLFLEEQFKITNEIQPACLSWKFDLNDEEPVSETFVQTAGWGIRKTKTYTEDTELKYLSPKYLDRETCINRVSESIIPYLTLDKFCTEYNDDSDLCNSDIGSGIFIKRVVNFEEKYFLYGVVSGNDLNNCSTSKFGINTKVSHLKGLIIRAI